PLHRCRRSRIQLRSGDPGPLPSRRRVLPHLQSGRGARSARGIPHGDAMTAPGTPAPEGREAPKAREAPPAPLHPLLAGGGEYPFVKLERRRRELAPPGMASINFGMGDPREETPAFIREALQAAIPAVSSYPATTGKPELRAACAAWLGRRHGVIVDPELHVLPAN